MGARRSRRLLLSGAMVGVAGFGQPLAAQTAIAIDPVGAAPLFRPDVAGTRPGPERAPGLAIGGWILRADAGIGALADSNVFNLPGDLADGDVAATLDANAALAREEGPRRYLLAIALADRAYVSLDEQHSVDAAIRAGGAIPVGPTEILSIGAEAARVTEPRGTGGLNFADAGVVQYHSLRATLGLASEGPKLRTAVTVSAARRSYRDVERPGAADLDLGFRDVRVLATDARLSYALTADTALLGMTRFDHTDSLNPPPVLTRDADGQRLLAGARMAFGDLVIGEAAVGWTARQFKSPAFRDYGGVTAYARIDWYPTPLTSYRLSIDQDFENSGLVNVAAVLSRSASFTQYWEVLRTLTLVTRVAYSHDRYRDLGVTTGSFSGSMGGDWHFRPDLALSFDVSARSRGSTAPVTINEYSGLSARLALKASL